MLELTSKQRAYLIGLANHLDPIVQIGKNGVSPDTVEAAEDAFRSHELIKVGVLKTAPDTPFDTAAMLAERTHAVNVKVIGRKAILYRPDKEKPVIVLPK
jgi:RNA-binding protein